MKNAKESYEDIYQEHAKFVYGFLLKKCHNQDLAEELTQETFFIAIQKIRSYDGTCKITTWLCGIANNLLRREFRRKDGMEVEENVALEIVDWDSAGIMKLVHGLEEPYREVVYLRLAANLSFAQIGDIMQMSENLARVTFFRGKVKIKEAFEHENSM